MTCPKSYDTREDIGMGGRARSQELLGNEVPVQAQGGPRWAACRQPPTMPSLAYWPGRKRS